MDGAHLSLAMGGAVVAGEAFPKVRIPAGLLEDHAHRIFSAVAVALQHLSHAALVIEAHHHHLAIQLSRKVEHRRV